MPDRKGAELEMWTIYDHPTDYPDHFIARRFVVTADGAKPCGTIILSIVLDDVRRTLSGRGFVKTDRSPGDDPKILETWL